MKNIVATILAMACATFALCVSGEDVAERTTILGYHMGQKVEGPDSIGTLVVEHPAFNGDVHVSWTKTTGVYRLVGHHDLSVEADDYCQHRKAAVDHYTRLIADWYGPPTSYFDRHTPTLSYPYLRFEPPEKCHTERHIQYSWFRLSEVLEEAERLRESREWWIHVTDPLWLVADPDWLEAKAAPLPSDIDLIEVRSHRLGSVSVEIFFANYMDGLDAE